MPADRDDLLRELESVYEEFAVLLESTHRERAIAYRELQERLAMLERANAELREARDERIRSERLMAMGELAGEIGHEINNYLSVLGGRAEMIGRAIERGDADRAREYARIVLEQVEKMRRLTRGLMDFSRPTTERRPEDPVEILADAAALLSVSARRAGVELVLDAPPGNEVVLADRAQLEQLLVNLIKNGIEAASGTGGASVTARIRMSQDRRELRFEISDNGRGIPAAVRGRLFEPHVTGREGGHGFGLAVAYRIARDHQGRIEVASEEGRGTTFAFVLPVSRETRKDTAELRLEGAGTS